MQGVQGPRAVRAARASLAGGVRRRVGGMCNCVWAWRGRREGETRAACVCRLRPSGAASPPVGKPAVCVCVCLCATQPGAGCGVWVRLVRRLRGSRASPVRRYTAGGGPPPAQRRMCVRAFAGLRGRARRAPHGATSVCGRGRITSGLSESRRGAVQGASGGGACASARPPDPVARGRLPKRRARQDGKKKCPKGGCTWVHRSRGGI